MFHPIAPLVSRLVSQLGKNLLTYNAGDFATKLWESKVNSTPLSCCWLKFPASNEFVLSTLSSCLWHYPASECLTVVNDVVWCCMKSMYLETKLASSNNKITAPSNGAQSINPWNSCRAFSMPCWLWVVGVGQSRWIDTSCATFSCELEPFFLDVEDIPIKNDDFPITPLCQRISQPIPSESGLFGIPTKTSLRGSGVLHTFGSPEAV